MTALTIPLSSAARERRALDRLLLRVAAALTASVAARQSLAHKNHARWLAAESDRRRTLESAYRLGMWPR